MKQTFDDRIDIILIYFPSTLDWTTKYSLEDAFLSCHFLHAKRKYMYFLHMKNNHPRISLEEKSSQDQKDNDHNESCKLLFFFS